MPKVQPEAPPNKETAQKTFSGMRHSLRRAFRLSRPINKKPIHDSVATTLKILPLISFVVHSNSS